mmetsp:Transcript_41667/g.131328  ORF Transcript_41667/g.131328 Transcript_41667/m.131328 type:complete len:105 (+) Transcript_41667:240-554(+)
MVMYKVHLLMLTQRAAVGIIVVDVLRDRKNSQKETRELGDAESMQVVYTTRRVFEQEKQNQHFCYRMRIFCGRSVDKYRKATDSLKEFSKKDGSLQEGHTNDEG